MASKKNSGTGRSALRLSDVARLGLTGLRARPMRAVLSALGIAIGIAAMVGVVGVAPPRRPACKNSCGHSARTC